ncbi:MAG: aldo/keto reductase [Burkholderiales bacterium]
MSAIAIGELTVNRLGFGAMRVCGPQVWGPPADRGNALRVLRRAYELGHNFFDTADSYGPEVSESLIAEALHPYPGDLVIGTKGGLTRPSAPAWERDARPEHLRRAIEGSLKRLRLERIDLYQLHAPDPKVPFAESVGALAELKKAGKIRHVGLSNVNLKELDEARRIVPVVSVQNAYSLERRDADAMIAACEKEGIAFLPWYPLAAGSALKSAKVRRIAEKHGATPAQVCIAWLLARSPAVLPIPGTSSLQHLEENSAAVKLELTPEDLADLT